MDRWELIVYRDGQNTRTRYGISKDTDASRTIGDFATALRLAGYKEVYSDGTNCIPFTKGISIMQSDDDLIVLEMRPYESTGMGM